MPNDVLNITLTDKQNQKLKQAVSWFNTNGRHGSEPVFPLLGVAGCLDKNTLITTNKGTLTLEEIILGSRDNLKFNGFEKYSGDLKVYNGLSFSSISDIYATDIMDGYEITLESGLSLKCSNIHPLLTIENSNMVWKKAHEIKEGMSIATLGNRNIYKNNDLKFKEDYYYLGYYHADGYYESNTKQICFTSKDKKRLIDLIDYLKRRHNYTGTEYIMFRESKNNYTFRFRSDTFIEMAKLVGLDVKNKILPISILTDRHKKYSYLKGLFNDLGIGKNELTFSSLHKINSERVMILCREFGIIFLNLKEKKNQYGTTWQIKLLKESIINFYEIFGNIIGAKFNYSIKEMYDDYMSKKNNTNKNLIENVEELFNIKASRENRKILSFHDYASGRRRPSYKVLNLLNEHFYHNSNENLNLILKTNYFYEKIISIKPIRQKFYDITVPKGHSFISNGILSHNSGKSTLLSFIIAELGLQDYEVAYCAYTGMASLVLIRKGLNATTIHRLIYIPVEVLDKETKKTKIIFKLKDNLPSEIKLIVVDEGSMVSEEMMSDLLSFNIPIMMLGDFFQLQPVGGKMNRFMTMTQYGVLDEPLRQALDSPIIWLSDQVRHGNIPKVGTYGDDVRVYHKSDFPEEILIESDQVIAGKNHTCSYLNKLIRIKFKGIKSRYPVDGDRLICVKNNWSKAISEGLLESYLVNGLIGTVSNLYYDNTKKLFKCNFKPIFMENTSFTGLLGDKLVFDDMECKDENHVISDYKSVAVKRHQLYSAGVNIDKFMYGNAITVYKMQGSQEKHITYVDEILRRDIYLNHFYTAVTRAEEKLDIVL